MSPQKRELLSFLQQQPRETFSISGRIDGRRYLPREFPPRLPLLLAMQSYPAYRRMIGEHWMHWHDYYELWVATEGGGEFRSGNDRFPFAPGDVVLVDPLKVHGVLRMESTHAPLVIFFRTEAVAADGAALDLGFLSAWDRRPEKLGPRLEGDAAATASVHGAILRLAQVWYGGTEEEERALMLKFYLLETLVHLRRAFLSGGKLRPDTISMRTEREARLGRVLEYMGRRFHTSLSQTEVAKAAGMSTSRFRLFFKETTGWGFADYLRDLRLERAAQLLRESSETVAAVAYQTGFSDQSHLQRLFKEKYAISPLAYRKQRQE